MRGDTGRCHRTRARHIGGGPETDRRKCVHHLSLRGNDSLRRSPQEGSFAEHARHKTDGGTSKTV